MKKYSLALGVIAMVFLAGLGLTLIASTPVAHATAPQSGATVSTVPLSGWAWSSNTGWISVNPSNSGTGGVSWSQPVSISTTSDNATIGFFKGYAWSSVVGWISFNPSDVNNCPSQDSATYDSPHQGAPLPTYVNSLSSPAYCTPRVDFSTGKVSGWARVMSMVPSNDGWVHLSGANHPTGDASGAHGVTMVTTVGAGATTYAFKGYAFEPSALGWITFNPSFGTTQGVTGDSSNSTNSAFNNLIAATCTGGAAVFDQSSSPASLTLNVTAQGGDGAPYTYTWNDGLPTDPSVTNTNASQTFSYSGVVSSLSSSNPGPFSYTPTVKVTDKNGHVSSTAFSCGVVKAQFNTNNDPVQLYIGKPGIMSTGSNYTISLGQQFRLDWKVNLPVSGPSAYACQVKPIGSGINYLSTWPIITITDSNTTAYSDDIPTASVPKGSYQFTLSCTNIVTNDTQTPRQPVTLKIQSTSIQEF
jgi:hypothetical protein